MSKFTEEQIELAKSIDLYDFILENPEFEDDFTPQGESLRWNTGDQIISVRRGSSYYNDWISGRGGDTIDFLTKLYG